VFAELLRQRLASLVALTPGQLAQLERHFLLLNKWNRVLNLTSLQGLAEIVERHYCESIFLGIHLPAGHWDIADIGSGAGFPGVPVAVLRPDCSVYLVESHRRKSVFLREATRDLGNAQVLSQRVEDLERSFDWAIFRAVRLSEIEKPLANICQSVGSLGGKQCPPTSRFTWNDPIKLPWGRERYLWIGTRRST